ncbi:SusD/RagB family nutrient-binding outer membrane lipoprotein [Mucilaginibacter boryungensis]|uniref:SusD/RagB family nutrient-binding outer membrane lipoprotein n=1 Tax=Mucilaginibacter boryungensis TaxID=768480 RepID=A0ABR9XKX5_9SPHI|nr:SusD/RagB family nutrient-binding outer membrane lipoprotein [Mucilaginibacter boryungensis]MBE9667618.1 SusD/RagB family nutrient-binding outer membrane lipoprotein [Mucilaginibacter boryungensis]
MTRHTKYSLITATICCVLSASCKKALDINTDPNKLSPEQATINNLLPSGEQYLASAFYGASRYGIFYTQQLAGNASYAANIDSYNPYGFDELWSSAYLSAMPNYKDIFTRADAAGAPQYAGIARLMMALTLMQSTDVWGDVPYKEAFQGTANITPHYDTMQDIYNTSLLDLLNKAIDNLNQPIPALASLKVGTTDLIYAGDITKWKKAAYAARARYYLHLAKKTAADYQLAINDVNNSFTDAADLNGANDLQLKYNTTQQNPWFTNVSNVAATSRYVRPSNYLVNLMNGDATAGLYPGLLDPRLPKLVDNGGKPTYIGRPVGTQDNEQGANLANVDITSNTYYGQNISPLPIITYAEIQFIKAEAYFNLNDKPNAYTAYLNGIKGNMTKLGVTTTDMNTYVNNPLISKGAANLTLSDIMLQKYIALFLQMETWTDMRRYQYDTSIYKNLTKPFRNLLPGGPWVQRGNYSNSEFGVNPNVPKNLDQTTKLWLFQ